MSKYCPMCNQITNCTDNCNSCLEEDEKEREATHQNGIVSTKLIK